MWLSVPFGIIITLICFSGAMLVFENEVNELMWPELYFVKQVEAAPLPVDQLLEKVAATLPDDVSVSGVSISSDPERTYQVSLSKPRRSSVYVDQYTGEITGKNQRSGFFAFMFRMHRWLLDSMNPGGEGIFWGKMIVGVSTLMFVVVLISGIIVWWPRTRKALKNSLKISGTKGWKRFWYDLHVAGRKKALPKEMPDWLCRMESRRLKLKDGRMPKNVEVAEEVVRTGRIEKNRKAYPQIIHKVNGRKATCMRAADIGNTSKLNSQSLLFLPLLIGRKYMTS